MFILIFISLFTSTLTCKFSFNNNKIIFHISDQWEWKASAGTKDELFFMSFCKSSTSCKDGASVCKQNIKTKASINYGILSMTPTTKLSADGSGFELQFDDGKKCANKTKKTQITFFCGKTLGELEFIEESDCVAYFEFSSNEICVSDGLLKQIPCYVFNKYGEKIDLMHLQKNTGGYKTNLPDFEFNVCSELKGSSCPSGTSVCQNSKSIGGIISDTSLKMSGEDDVKLLYSDQNKNCSTEITFKCPTVHQETMAPFVISTIKPCFYEIQWFTEFACPVKDQLVKNSCKFSNGKVQFDLSPLKVSRDRTIIQSQGKDNYTIYFNVCGKLRKEFDCNGNTNASVCQEKKGTKNNTKIVLGTSNDTILRYVDNKLIYIMRGGDKCHNRVRRSTVITFICNMTIGVGKAVFSHEDKCTYFMDWPTSYACSHYRGVGSECRLTTNKNVVFDLTPLVISEYQTGLLNGHNVIFKVCGYLSDINKCGEKTSACIQEKGKPPKRLGGFGAGLQIKNNELVLKYVNGSKCDENSLFSTEIIFICSPGKNSPLNLLKDGPCHYVIEWQTEYACPLHETQGTSCFFADSALGLHIDLNWLQPPAEKKKSYFTVKTPDYDYELNICKGSKLTDCNHGIYQNKSITSCQVSTKDRNVSKVAGLYEHESLYYYGGVLNLQYADGERCHRNNKKRMTEISFVCDRKAGVGEPKFEKEAVPCFYKFIWETKFACLPKGGVCSVEKNGLMYDLSPLTKYNSSNTWFVRSSDGTYHINVCRPLTKYKCSPFTAVCFEPKSVAADIDYGEVADPLKVLDNGELVLIYRNGWNCSSQINFICEKGGLGSPVLLKKTGTCQKYFTWRTSAACPEKNEIGQAGTCTVIDDNGNTYNLSSLAAPYGYNVTASTGVLYHINICGTSKSCSDGMAACTKDKLIGKVSRQLKYEKRTITLTYRGTENEDGILYRTVIKFLCNSDVKQKLTFEAFDQDFTYYFIMHTSKACAPEATQCIVENKNGVMYNLQSMTKKTGYWTALSRSISMKTFIVNICYPLPNEINQACGSPVRACQTKRIGGDKDETTGFQERKISVYDNVVSILYYDHQSSVVLPSARIFLHCSSSQGSPYFQLTANNASTFNWLTPAACPITKNVGSNCKVTDDRNEHLFDLSQLKQKHYQTNLQENKVLKISVCEKEPACGSNSGACVKNGTKFLNLGDFNEKLIYTKEGGLVLIYTSGDYKMTIRFICNSDLALKILTVSDKLYEIEWSTQLACKPKLVECSVTSPKTGYHYDLSPLSKSDFNWRAEVGDDYKNERNSKMFINVCRPLVKGNTVKGCSSAAGLCVVDKAGKSINIGHMESPPQLLDGNILLTYTNGDVCKTGVKYSAKIILLHEDAESLGQPLFTGAFRGGCEYHFSWKTNAAWHILNSKRATELTNDCRVENKLSGNYFDLNLLHQDTGYKVSDGEGKLFDVNICGHTSNKCGNTCAVCHTSKESAVNYGESNTKLYLDEFLYMKFENGDRKTVITFVCDHTGKFEKPQLVSNTETDNTIFFVWRTIHACEKAVQCTAFSVDGQVMHLDQLSKSRFYEFEDSKDKYRLSVCKTSLGCPASSAVCSIKNGKSFGSLHAPPIWIPKDNTVMLNYANGDLCEGNKHWMSVVSIVCDRNIKLPTVTVKSKSNCVYNFEMKTSLVCPQTFVINNCSVNYHGHTYDFTSLQKTQLVDKTNSRYYVNVCAKTTVNVDACKTAAVCMMKADKYTNLGEYMRMSWRVHMETEQIFLDYGLVNNKRKSTIAFSCDPLTPIGSPQLRSGFGDNYIFDWKTSFLCLLPTLSNLYMNKEGRVILDVGQFNKEQVINIDNVRSPKMVLYVNIVGFQSINNKPKGCPQTAAVCMKKDSEPMQVLALVESRSVSNIETESPVITFKSLKNCANGKPTKVFITVKCGKDSKEFVFGKFEEKTCEYHLSVTSKSPCRKTPTDSSTKTLKPTNEKNKSKYSKWHGTAIAVVAVAIVAAIFLICISVLLSRKERRYTLESTIRALFCCAKVKIPSYKYVKVSIFDNSL